MALPIELRKRVVAAYKANEGIQEELAKRFKVGVCSVRRWLVLERETGDVKKRPRGGGTPPNIPIERLSELVVIVQEKPDRTTQELTDEWNKRNGTCIARSSVVRALKRAGLSLKKSFPRIRKAPGSHRGANGRISE